MKKFTFFLLIVTAAISAVAGPVEQKRAIKVAAHMACVDENRLQDVGVIAGLEHLYCFNYSDGDRQGFVIVSSNDAAMPVLAFSEEELLDPNDLNPSVRWWLSQYDRSLSALGDRKADGKVARMWEALETGTLKEGNEHEDVEMLLGGIKWGQGKPYNNRCPAKNPTDISVTGCVATAFGQIMYYWKFPEHGWGSHSYTGEGKPIHYPDWTFGTLSADFEHTYYDWDHMLNKVFINSTDSAKTAVATLLYHLGVALDMNYSPEGSGCWSLFEYSIADGAGELDPQIGAEYRIPRYFGYRYDYAGMRDSIGNDSVWHEMLYKSLSEGKPIYYAGWAADESPSGHSNTSGHGFIIDGYRGSTGIPYYHLNWGWDGSGNAWFTIDGLTPNGNDFTQWHGAIIGLEPDSTYNGELAAGISNATTAHGKAYGQQGTLVVNGAENHLVEVYDMMGRAVAQRGKSADGDWRCALPSGLYVVKIGNEKGIKVVVK